jgi:hypothetical protein
MTTSAARKRANFARNYGDEAKLVRGMDCIVHTAAKDSGASDVELAALEWTACGGAACAHHVWPRQRGGHGEGRFGLFAACARHGDQAGEASPIKGPSSKRRAFESLYGVDVVRIADGIALGHEPPLGIRGLAERFAWWHEHGHLGVVADIHAVFEDAPPRLEGYDLAALRAWVGRRMEAIAADPSVHATEADFADIIASDLSLSDGWPLCELAGWPS